MRRYAGSRALIHELMFASIILCFCMAVCAGVFMAAARTCERSRRLSGAVFAAQTAAEAFAAGGGALELARELGGRVEDGGVVVGLDRDLRAVGAGEGEYVMRVSIRSRGYIEQADIFVSAGETMFELQAVRLKPE